MLKVIDCVYVGEKFLEEEKTSIFVHQASPSTPKINNF